MGKTQSGAVWLDPNKTSPFDFFQYWRNVADSDVLKCIRMLTFLPLEQIDEMDKWEGAKLNEAKEILAYELTKLVHGEEEAKKAKEASHALFAGGGVSAHMPTVEVTADDLYNDKLDIMAVLVKASLCVVPMHVVPYSRVESLWTVRKLQTSVPVTCSTSLPEKERS